MTYPQPENLTTMTEIFRYANNVSESFFGSGILISLYIIIISYLKLRGTETANAFVVAGFITTITAMFLFLMEIIGNWELFAAVMSLSIPLIWAYLDKD